MGSDDLATRAIEDPGLAEEADVDETAPSFEEFYEATFQSVFSVLCLDKLVSGRTRASNSC